MSRNGGTDSQIQLDSALRVTAELILTHVNQEM